MPAQAVQRCQRVEVAQLEGELLRECLQGMARRSPTYMTWFMIRKYGCLMERTLNHLMVRVYGHLATKPSRHQQNRH